MHEMVRTPRRCAAPALLLAAALAGAAATPAAAYFDANANRIDDRIEDVHANGWSAAFVDRDVTKRMRIGVENPLAVVYAVYVGYDSRPTAADELALASTGVTMVWPFMNIDYIESRATFAQIQAIAGLPGVTHVEAVPVDYATNHYGARVVRARDSRGLANAENFALHPSARGELGLDGDGVVVAILDTGVNDEQSDVWPGFPGHEALEGKWLGGGEFWCGQPACATPADQSINPQQNGDAGLGYHGTHVAATAIGTGGPGGFFGGVAPGARLVDGKVLSDAGASVGGSNRGLDWCISNRNRLWAGLEPGSKWQGIDVINMSLGSTECLTGSASTGAGSQLVNTAVNNGLVVVIATGNDDAIGCIASPASADLSIAVGATGHRRTLDRSDDGVTGFSNEGPRHDDGDADHKDEMKPNVVAPGDGIVSAEGDPRITDGNDYAQASGTSMAAPHVAGVAAVVLQANPNLTPLELRTILENTADHFVPSDKGPFRTYALSTDPNYDPASGYGLVDTYAAALEAMNSTSGVQMIQVRAIARPDDGAIDVRWVTQREYPFLGFDVHRAPDVNGAPGTWTKLNGVPVLPQGDPVIQNDDNRTVYTLADNGPGLVRGGKYWYRVDWIDLGTVAHAVSPVQVTFGVSVRVATAFYSIAHDAVDNDLLVRVGVDRQYTPGTLGQADFEVLGSGENGQDSARVVLPQEGTGTSIGEVEHFWSVGFSDVDGVQQYLPPSAANPWFLYVVDGGFVNTQGRVTGYSLFVNDSPGSASGTTYATDHVPMPQPTVEGGVVPVTLWIPEAQPTAVEVMRFAAQPERDAVRLVLELAGQGNGTEALVHRSTSIEFETRTALGAPVPFSGTRFEYVDRDVEPGATYHYWLEVREGGRSIMNGPVSVTTGGAAITWAKPAQPNPVSRDAVFEYAVGADAARGARAEVTLVLRDLSGRTVRTLVSGAQEPGVHRATWDAADDRGRRVQPGVYYAELRAGAVRRTSKVTVVR